VVYRRRDSLRPALLFMPPTLITGMNPAILDGRTKFFGPVLVSTTIPHPRRRPVELANNTRYGLGRRRSWSMNSIWHAWDIGAQSRRDVADIVMGWKRDAT